MAGTAGLGKRLPLHASQIKKTRAACCDRPRLLLNHVEISIELNMPLYLHYMFHLAEP